MIKSQTKLLDEIIMQLVQKCCAAMPFPLMITVSVATQTVIMRGNGIAAQHFWTNCLMLSSSNLVWFLMTYSGEKLGCPWHLNCLKSGYWRCNKSKTTSVQFVFCAPVCCTQFQTLQIVLLKVIGSNDFTKTFWQISEITAGREGWIQIYSSVLMVVQYSSSCQKPTLKEERLENAMEAV